MNQTCHSKSRLYTPFNIQVSASEDYGKDVSHVEILIKSFDTFLQSVQEFEIKINRVAALGQGIHDKVFQKTVLEQKQKTRNITFKKKAGLKTQDLEST